MWFCWVVEFETECDCSIKQWQIFGTLIGTGGLSNSDSDSYTKATEYHDLALA